jgi:hypothetical protein
MVGQLEMLAHPVGHLAPAGQRHRRVAVDRAGRLDEVEDGLVVLERLGRELVELPAVEPELPAGQVSHIAIEEAIGVADGCCDIAEKITDHKRGALEDAHLAVTHELSPHRELTHDTGSSHTTMAGPLGVRPDLQME